MVMVLSIAITGFFAAIAIYTPQLAPLQRVLENFSFSDIYYEINREVTTGDTCRVITIVDLTKLTNRTVIAETIEDIEAAHPKVLTVDACFDNFGEDLGGNLLITEVAAKYNNIVWSMKCLDYKNDSIGWSKTIHSFFTEEVKVREGSSNMPRGNEYDSMKRKVPLGELALGKRVPSLCLQTAELYTGRDIDCGRTEDISINYSPTVFRKLNPKDVRKHPELIEGQIVLLGSLYEDADTHWTPVGKIAGVQVLAYGIQTLIYDRQPKEMPTALFYILSLLMILFMQTLQAWYIDRTSASRSLFVRYVVGSGYVIGLWTALFTFIFLFFGYLLFTLYCITFNIAWAMSVVAFLGTSRSMYDAIRDYISARRKS